MAKCNSDQACIDKVAKKYFQINYEQEAALFDCRDSACIDAVRASLADSQETLEADAEALSQYSMAAADRLLAQQQGVGGAEDQTSVDLRYAEAGAAYCGAHPGDSNCSLEGKLLLVTANGVSAISIGSLGTGGSVGNAIIAATEEALDALAPNIDGAQQPIVFRGTTDGYVGSDAAIRCGVTCTSTDPAVAALFATEGEAYGNGVVHIATPNDLAGIDIVPPNVLAEQEAEVVLGTTPTDFANRASITLTAAEARGILQDMGIAVPSSVTRAGGQFNQDLASLPRLTSDQITQFVNRAKAIEQSRN